MLQQGDKPISANQIIAANGQYTSSHEVCSDRLKEMAKLLLHSKCLNRRCKANTNINVNAILRLTICNTKHSAPMSQCSTCIFIMLRTFFLNHIFHRVIWLRAFLGRKNDGLLFPPPLNSQWMTQVLQWVICRPRSADWWPGDKRQVATLQNLNFQPRDRPLDCGHAAERDNRACVNVDTARLAWKAEPLFLAAKFPTCKCGQSQSSCDEVGWRRVL